HDVAHHRELVAAAERVAGDRGDHWLPDAPDVLPVARDVVRHIGVHVAVVLHHADVGAGGEGLLAPGDNYGAYGVVGVICLQRHTKLLHELRIERVQLLRPAERDEADAAFLVHGDEFSHASSSATKAAWHRECRGAAGPARRA